MANQNIPGIYNYCDRWCERCAFTSRCAVYEGEVDEEEKDMRNQAFWERLSENFSKAHELLDRVARESGIDLDAIEAKAEQAERTREEIKLLSKQHPMIKMIREYATFTKTWLQTQPGMLEKLEVLKDELTLGIETQQAAKKQTITIKDSLAVINWYKSFIEPKLMRALMGKSDYLDIGDDFNDADGSAKIAIIAIERSMQAWMSLFELLPEQEDQFLQPLSLLERVKKEITIEFPNAMKFKRPGFDDQL